MQLDMGTKPQGLTVKTYSWGMGDLSGVVFVGDYEISLPDFLAVASYVLTNTDLAPDDPRRQFVQHVAAMKAVGGFNQGGERFESDVPLFAPATPIG